MTTLTFNENEMQLLVEALSDFDGAMRSVCNHDGDDTERERADNRAKRREASDLFDKVRLA